MGKGKIIRPFEVKAYVCDETYSSKMLLDDQVAGTKAIHINEGTLQPGCKTAGGVHQATEIYYAVKGAAILHLDDEASIFRAGSVAVIPAGVFHSLDNLSDREEFVLLTLWEHAGDNETYHTRLRAWGTAFKTIYDD